MRSYKTSQTARYVILLLLWPVLLWTGKTEWKTRLPSNLKPTTRECVHLVTHGHFRSHDKDGGYTIRSAASENPMLHTDFMALRFIEPELLRTEVLHCGNRDFWPVCSCDLDLDPMTFIHEFNPYSLEVYRMCKYELPKLRLSKVRLTDRQTDRQTDTIEITGWLKKVSCYHSTTAYFFEPPCIYDAALRLIYNKVQTVTFDTTCRMVQH